MQKLFKLLRSGGVVRPGSARWITDQLLVVGDPGPVIPAVALVAEPGVVAVLVGVDAGGPGLIDTIAQRLPSGTPCLLLAAGAGTPAAVDQPPPAVVLARRLRSEVLAPVGSFHLVPGGTAFSPAGWVRATPDGATSCRGTRYPAPWWGAVLDELDRTAPPAVRVTQLPAGVWVRSAEGYRADIRPPAFDIPLSHTRIQFILGHPGTALPAEDQVERLLDQLPPEAREHVVLVPQDRESGRNRRRGAEIRQHVA